MFKPLFDLLTQVCHLDLDVLMLIGPFFDSGNSLFSDPSKTCELQFTVEELFHQLLSDILKKLESKRTKLIIVPSVAGKSSTASIVR